MKFYEYLEFNGVEIANANRTLAYIQTIGDSRLQGASEGSCYCDAVNDGPYTAPADDPAPWYSSDPASEDFLGIYASDLRVTGNVLRDAIPKGEGGASLTRPRAQHKTITVTGLMIANSALGMQYGERWLRQVLAGSIGCASAEAVLLPACPEGAGSAGDFLRLLGVGVIDGPNPMPITGVPECFIQQVFFQLASSQPYFLSGDTVECLAETVIADDTFVTCSFTGAPAGDTATLLTIKAGTADVEGLVIFGEPCGGYVDEYSDTYDDDAPGTMRYAEYRVISIPANHRLEIDAAAETVKLINIANGQVVGGFDALEFSGAFEWIRASDGTTACLHVSAMEDATVNAGTTVKVETIERHV